MSEASERPVKRAADVVFAGGKRPSSAFQIMTRHALQLADDQDQAFAFKRHLA